MMFPSGGKHHRHQRRRDTCMRLRTHVMTIVLIATVLRIHRPGNLPVGRTDRGCAMCPDRRDDPRYICVGLGHGQALLPIVVSAIIEDHDLGAGWNLAGTRKHACAGLAVDGIDADVRIDALRAQHTLQLSRPGLGRADAYTVGVTGTQRENIDRSREMKGQQ